MRRSATPLRAHRSSSPSALDPGAEKTIRLTFAWYFPSTNIRAGDKPAKPNSKAKVSDGTCVKACGDDKEPPENFIPYYATRFASIKQVAEYWQKNYVRLRAASALFRDTFYDTTLPPEVIEAVAANLTILKSPTVLRQQDGRLWGWEGNYDAGGCCHGSCTHVWNYAQSITHLYPSLERSLRDTEYHESFRDGAIGFRANMPISDIQRANVAVDGQLGGLMKVYREWRVSGDTAWLKRTWPHARQSLDYIIEHMDPAPYRPARGGPAQYLRHQLFRSQRPYRDVLPGGAGSGDPDRPGAGRGHGGL